MGTMAASISSARTASSAAATVLKGVASSSLTLSRA